MNGRVALERPIYLTREGGQFRLSFGYRPDLVEKVKGLPYARFDPDSKTWTTEVCEQTIHELREWFSRDGLTDVYVDTLLEVGEKIEAAPEAVIRPGNGVKRPYLVQMARRNEQMYTRLRSVPGAQWEQKAQAMSFPATAAVALAELVSRGVLVDPQKLLSPSEITVSFDGRAGAFKVLGDERADAAFKKHFPERDVVAEWREKGFDVGFGDSFTEEVYRGEIARQGPGIQPDGMMIDLFEYQRKNVAVALERSGTGVFDTPGLGKSATGIAWALELMNRGVSKRAVIVAPGAVKTQWAREITRFIGHEDVTVIDGDKKKREKLYAEAQNSRWVVLNYDLLHLDFKQIGTLVSGALLVADEAHRLKTYDTKRSKAMRQLAGRAARRLALTGTPIENNPGEFYSVMSGFIVPGVFGNPIDFLNRYQYPNRWGGFEGARNLGELRNRAKPHFVRHTKAEVATHLPPLRVQHIPIDPDPAYASALKRAHREARNEIAEAAAARAAKRTNLNDEQRDEIESGAEMTAVGMLRLMCLSPRLVVESEAAAAKALCESGLVPEQDGPKLDYLRGLASEMQAAGERLVVFTFSKKMIDLITDRLSTDGVSFVTYTGETNTADRDKAVKAFTTETTEEQPGPTVFLATDAGAEGLNLGKCCSTLINLDIPWTPGRFEQRSNRIHRIDGTSPSYLVMNTTLKGTLEEGILRMVEQKADLVDAIFGEKGGRRRTTGRGGRNIFEEALKSWEG